jgi:hypothetical protein
MFSFQPFSKPRLVSIGLLLAILVISLMFSSYVEGMNESATDESTDQTVVSTVNKDAPLTKELNLPAGLSKDLSTKDLSTKDLSTKDLSTKDLSTKDLSTKDLKPLDGIDLGASKTLSVTDITGLLKNNAGVQKLIDNTQKMPNSK